MGVAVGAGLSVIRPINWGHIWLDDWSPACTKQRPPPPPLLTASAAGQGSLGHCAYQTVGGRVLARVAAVRKSGEDGPSVIFTVDARHQTQPRRP